MKSANPKDVESLDLFPNLRVTVRPVEIIGHNRMSWFFAMFAEAEKRVKAGEQFTAEDLTDAVGEPPHNCNATGSVMALIVKRLGLQSLGRIKSRRVSSHGRKMELWGK